VGTASFRIYSQNVGATFSVYLGNSDGWSQSGAVPGYGGAAVATATASAAGYLSFNVTTAVAAQAAGDDLITFAVVANTDTWNGINSRENAASRPELVVAGTPPPTGATLTPTDDRDTQSDVVAGTNATIHSSLWNTSYFRFSLASLGAVNSATFRVYTRDAATFSLYLGNSDGWSQGGSVPGYGGSPLATVAAAAEAYVSFNVTSIVSAQAAGDDLITFALTASTDSWNRIYSRESATNKPQLIVNGGSDQAMSAAAPMTLSSQPTTASSGLWSTSSIEEEEKDESDREWLLK
jgi:hypothetical protein